jgi:hypothetical protein
MHPALINLGDVAVQKIVTAIHASPDCLYQGRAAGLLAKARVFTL